MQGVQVRDGNWKRGLVDDLCDAYVDRCRIHYRKPTGRPTKTVDNVIEALKPLRQMFGQLTARQFVEAPIHLQQIQSAMLDPDRPALSTRSHGGPLKPRTINDRVNWIRACFAWGADMAFPGLDHLGVMRLKAVRNLRCPKRRPKAVSWDDVSDVIAHAPPKIATMIEIQWHTAMRPDEVCGLNLAELDRSADPWIYRPGSMQAHSHKSEHHGYEREIHVGPMAQSTIRSWLLRVRQPATGDPGWLFPRRGGGVSGGPMQRNSYYTAIQRCITKHGLRRWHPHQIRHAGGFRYRGEGGLDEAQVILGHQHASTTEIYAPPSKEKAIEAARRLG